MTDSLIGDGTSPSVKTKGTYSTWLYIHVCLRIDIKDYFSTLYTHTCTCKFAYIPTRVINFSHLYNLTGDFKKLKPCAAKRYLYIVTHIL